MWALFPVEMAEKELKKGNDTFKVTNWNDHYDDIAVNYDRLYEYKIETFADIAITWLDINKDDKIADIGGGTGGVAEHIKKKCPELVSNILVVDPSPKSIEIAKNKKGLDVMVANVNKFLASQESQIYNKYLFSCVVHHFPDQEATFKEAYKRLPLGGIMVILYHPKEPYLPLWKEANEYRYKIEPETDETSVLLERAGFTITLNKITKKIDLDREDYYQKLRNRIMSTLHSFTDEAIEKGIKELDETVFKGADSITIDDVTCVIQAVKK